MKTLSFAVLAATLVLQFPATVVSASVLERACVASPRAPGQRQLCSCIQRVADQMLTAQDQRRAARFFDDPHQAQVTRQSDNRSDEAFWERYKAFGQSAERICS
ncbi:MAG: hypothetical protein AAGF74_08985 [Pseudomonadota bacterium]